MTDGRSGEVGSGGRSGPGIGIGIGIGCGCGKTEEGFQESAVSFGGTAGTGFATGGAVVLGGFAGALEVLRGGEVLEEFGDSRGGDAIFEQGSDPDDAGEVTAADAEEISGAEVAGGFDGELVEADVATATGFGGEGAGFEEAHGPEPLVDAHRVGGGCFHGLSRGGVMVSGGVGGSQGGSGAFERQEKRRNAQSGDSLERRRPVDLDLL